MAILHRIGALVVLLSMVATICHTQGVDFGECLGDCSGGVRRGQKQCGLPPCGFVVLSCLPDACPSEPVPEAYGACTESCGNGKRELSSGLFVPCAENPCQPATGESCSADVVYAMDRSASLGNDGLQYCKEAAKSIFQILSGAGPINFGFVIYDSEMVASGELSDNPQPHLDVIESAEISSDADYAPNGIIAAMDILSSGQSDNQALIVCTRGSVASMTDTHAAVNAALDAGIAVHIIGGDRMQVGAARAYSPANGVLIVADATLEDSCKSYTLGYTPVEQIAQSLNAMSQAEGVDDDCVTTIEPCSESCGADGFNATTEVCDDVEFVSNSDIEPCFVPCMTTPPDNVCERCDYSRGQVWLVREDNCHLYIVCEKRVWEDGSVTYEMHPGTCGLLYWDPERLTCVRDPVGSCIVGDPVTWNAPSTTPAPCPYYALADPQRFASKEVTDAEYSCVDGMEFIDSDDVCTCEQVSNIDPKCSSELLLDFPYDIDLNDVTCHHANGYSYPSDGVIIVDDAERGKVAHFPGNAHVQVPFLRNWFKDHKTRKWTVTVFVKRISGDTLVGIVDNGDCVDSASFLIRGDGDGAGTPSSFSGAMTNKGSEETGRLNMEHGVWYKLGLVYDGNNLYHYSKKASHLPFVLADGILVPLKGYFENTQNPMKIGLCDCGVLSFWHGRMDDLKVWTKAINPPNA